jgi:hypothetical protein
MEKTLTVTDIANATDTVALNASAATVTTVIYYTVRIKALPQCNRLI